MNVICELKSMGNALLLQSPYKLNLEDGTYQVSIKSLNEMKRSDKQNALMWSIVNKICKKLNGNTNDSYELYSQILEMANVSYTDIVINHEALETFKKMMHIKVVSQKIVDGIQKDYCWVFKGISEMNVKEANELIDVVINYAGEVGIDVDENYWRDILNG